MSVIIDDKQLNDLINELNAIADRFSQEEQNKIYRKVLRENILKPLQAKVAQDWNMLYLTIKMTRAKEGNGYFVGPMNTKKLGAKSLQNKGKMLGGFIVRFTEFGTKDRYSRRHNAKAYHNLRKGREANSTSNKGYRGQTPKHPIIIPFYEQTIPGLRQIIYDDFKKLAAKK